MSQYDDYREAFRKFGQPTELIDHEHKRIYQIFDSQPDRRVATIKIRRDGQGIFESFGLMSGPQ